MKSTIPFVILLLIITSTVGLGQVQVAKHGLHTCVLQPLYEDVFVHVPPPAVFFAKRPVTADIQVTYSTNFPASAKTAFDYAVSIWEALITSPVTITIEANWVALDANVLGQAGPEQIFANFPNAPLQLTWYPSALANKLARQDQSPQSTDITANFNSNFTNFYFGTDGNPPSAQFDFVTVVLHELGHGLGFVGSMSVDAGMGQWGITPQGLDDPLPYIYDLFIEDETSTLLTGNSYPNPSVALANALTNDNVYFSGNAADNANDSDPVKLYAPSNWNEGSSYAHLDRNTFPSGTENSLMKPSISATESIHSPGPVTLGIFQDLGWTVADTLVIPPGPGEEEVPETFELRQNWPNPFPTPSNPTTLIEYILTEDSNVRVTIFNNLGERVRTFVPGLQVAGSVHSVLWDGRDDASREVASGLYIYRVVAGSQAKEGKMLLVR